jgi:CRP-like cAMP-binding protein
MKLARNRNSLQGEFDRFLGQIGNGRSVATYPPDGKIFAQGDPADAIFFIQTGNAKVSVLSNNGKEAVVGIFGAGDFLGQACLSDQGQRPETATAKTTCTIERIEKSAMMQALRKEPQLSRLFIEFLLQRNLRIEEDLVDLKINPAEKRLARALMRLANCDGSRKPVRVPHPISQETLAGLIGTTRSHVNFFMNKFRREGLIDYNDTVVVYPSLSAAAVKD